GGVGRSIRGRRRRSEATRHSARGGRPSPADGRLDRSARRSGTLVFDDEGRSIARLRGRGSQGWRSTGGTCGGEPAAVRSRLTVSRLARVVLRTGHDSDVRSETSRRVAESSWSPAPENILRRSGLPGSVSSVASLPAARRRGALLGYLSQRLDP